MTEAELKAIENRLTGALDKAMQTAFPRMHQGARRRLCRQVADIATADVQSAYHDTLRAEARVVELTQTIRDKDREIGRIRTAHRNEITKIVTALNRVTKGLTDG